MPETPDPVRAAILRSFPGHKNTGIRKLLAEEAAMHGTVMGLWPYLGQGTWTAAALREIDRAVNAKNPPPAETEGG